MLVDQKDWYENTSPTGTGAYLVKYTVKSYMVLMRLAGKSYKLEHNSRKMSRKLVLDD